MAKKTEDQQEQEQEAQEEFGWEDLRGDATTGRPDVIEVEEEEEESAEEEQEEQEPEVQQEAEEPEEAEVTAEEPAEAEPTEEVTEEPAGEEPPAEDIWAQEVKLRDGRTVTRKDIAADPELIDLLLTHSHQVGHSNELAEKRGTENDQLKQQNQELINLVTLMKAKMEQGTAPPPEQAPPPPTREQLFSAYKPQIDAEVAAGRITEYEAEEHGGLIAVQMHENMQTRQLLGEVLNRIGSVSGVVNEGVKISAEEAAIRDAEAVRAQLVAMGPEFASLQEDDNWTRLNEELQGMIVKSGGLINPAYDAETLARLWFGMNRDQFLKEREFAAKQQRQKEEIDRRMAAGESGGGGGTPPEKKKPKPKAPIPGEEEGWSNLSGGNTSLAHG